jgi:hypothetical protein
LIVFSNSNVLEEKMQCLIQNPGNDPVASVASGFCLMFGKPADRRLAVLSAAKNCIEETVGDGTERIPPISKATIWIRSSEKMADPHRIQLNPMLMQMQIHHRKAGST